MSWEQDAENLLSRINRDSYEFTELWGIHSYTVKPVSDGRQIRYFLQHQRERSILTEPRPDVLLGIEALAPFELKAQITAIEQAPETLAAMKKHPTEHALVITGIHTLLQSAPDPYRTNDRLSKEFLTSMQLLRDQRVQ